MTWIGAGRSSSVLSGVRCRSAFGGRMLICVRTVTSYYSVVHYLIISDI